MRVDHSSISRIYAQTRSSRRPFFFPLQELGRAREALARAETSETQDKLERKRDEALQKVSVFGLCLGRVLLVDAGSYFGTKGTRWPLRA